jgi:pSer/pThr/pTyr-binding forkhead associated (FHA) protein
LDAKRAALTTHKRGVYRQESTTDGMQVAASSLAGLRDRTGRLYPLAGAITRIGRFTDNDIVLDDTDVSRHHAVITDTGTGFMMTDLRSTNGVEVQGQRIRGSATLADGDHIRIGGHEFTFEVRPG